MGWELPIKPKTWVILFLYLFLTYLVVEAFTVQSIDDFSVGSALPSFAYKFGNVIADPTNDTYIPVWSEILGFFDIVMTMVGYLIDFIVMAFNFMTFNIVNPVGLPLELTWIPFLMVLPVWIVVWTGMVVFILEIADKITKVNPIKLFYP